MHRSRHNWPLQPSNSSSIFSSEVKYPSSLLFLCASLVPSVEHGEAIFELRRLITICAVFRATQHLQVLSAAPTAVGLHDRQAQTAFSRRKQRQPARTRPRHGRYIGCCCRCEIHRWPPPPRLRTDDGCERGEQKRFLRPLGGRSLLWFERGPILRPLQKSGVLVLVLFKKVPGREDAQRYANHIYGYLRDIRSTCAHAPTVHALPCVPSAVYAWPREHAATPPPWSMRARAPSCPAHINRMHSPRRETRHEPRPRLNKLSA